MRDLIESLDEALINPIAMIGKHPEEPLKVDSGETESEPDEDAEPVEEAVSASVIAKMAEAMVASPKLGQYLAKAVKGSQVSEDDLRTAIAAHVRSALPLALSDVGANVQKALAGRSRRQAKAIAQGKSATEAIEMTDDEFAESEFEAELSALVGED